MRACMYMYARMHIYVCVCMCTSENEGMTLNNCHVLHGAGMTLVCVVLEGLILSWSLRRPAEINDECTTPPTYLQRKRVKH